MSTEVVEPAGSLLTNWNFWTAFLAGLAIVLSQLPPVHRWFRGAKLSVEVFTRIALTHKVGNPNASMHLTVRNIGGRSVRVKGLVLTIRREAVEFSLPMVNYYQDPKSADAVLFVPFTLKPEAEWSHVANYFKAFDRATDRQYRELERALKRDIQAKREAAPDLLAEADQNLVEPFLTFFDQRFQWVPGDFRVAVTIETEPASARVIQNYRFVLLRVVRVLDLDPR